MAQFRSWISAVSAIALLASAGSGVAQSVSPGDPQHGKAIAAGPPEVPAEQACGSCHGDTGEGNPDAAIPRLAAQSQDYLLRALAEYANGLRQNEIMTPIAKSLDATQRADVTAFYASLGKGEWAKPQNADAALMKRGEALASLGSAERGVQGCMNCHGPQGRGLPPTAPYLAGQPADYLASRLTQWQQSPKGDDAAPATIMARIAQRLDEQDIRAVSAYFAQQAPDAIRLGEATPEAKP